MPRPRPSSPFTDLFREFGKSFAKQTVEILTNTMASALDDALERIESKGEELSKQALSRVRHARGVAQRRSRQGRQERRRGAS
jgi:hypothetical protein